MEGLNEIEHYGDLIVINKKEGGKRLCKCVCGSIKEYYLSNLKKNNNPSCGCKRSKKVSEKLTTHGMTNTRLYETWVNMKSRCSNKNVTGYKDYGGKGIRVCEEWQNSFESFRDWSLVSGYTEDLTIDRIDNDKGYSPKNCRWSDMKGQSRNREYAWYIELDGVKRHAKDWCEVYGIEYKTLHSRVSRGWDEIKALKTPVLKKKYGKSKVLGVYKGRERIALGNIDELSEELGVAKKTLRWYGSKAYKDKAKKDGKVKERIMLYEVVEDEPSNK